MKLPVVSSAQIERLCHTDTEVRQDQSRQRQEHLLGPNWSLLQLMASCGCVFTSHLFCVLCFPAPETRESHFKSLFPQLSVCPSLTVCLPPSLFFFTQKQKKLAFSKLQHNDSYLKSLPKTSYYLVGFVPGPQVWLYQKKMWKRHLTFICSVTDLCFIPHYDIHQSVLPLCLFSEIFDLQRQLAERGHLKTHHDLEDFYRCIKYSRHPSQLHKSLEDVRKKSWVTVWSINLLSKSILQRQRMWLCLYVGVMLTVLESRSAADLMTQYKTSENPLCTAEDRGHETHISPSRWQPALS